MNKIYVCLSVRQVGYDYQAYKVRYRYKSNFLKILHWREQGRPALAGGPHRRVPRRYGAVLKSVVKAI